MNFSRQIKMEINLKKIISYKKTKKKHKFDVSAVLLLLVAEDSSTTV